MSALVHRQQRSREGRGGCGPAEAPRGPRKLLQRHRAFPGRIRAHGDDHFQRVHRPQDRRLHAESSGKTRRQRAPERSPRHASLRRHAEHRGHVAEGHRNPGIRTRGRSGGQQVHRGSDRRAERSGHRHGRHHLQGQPGPGRPDRARLPARVRALQHSGAEDLGGLHRRGRRQHRLDRRQVGPAEGGPPGSGGLSRPRGLRCRRSGAHRVRCRRGPGLPEPRVLSRGAYDAGQGCGHGRHRGAHRQAAGHDHGPGRRRDLPHHQCPHERPHSPLHGGAWIRPAGIRHGGYRRIGSGSCRALRRAARGPQGGDSSDGIGPRGHRADLGGRDLRVRHVRPRGRSTGPGPSQRGLRQAVRPRRRRSGQCRLPEG